MTTLVLATQDHIENGNLPNSYLVPVFDALLQGKKFWVDAKEFIGIDLNKEVTKVKKTTQRKTATKAVNEQTTDLRSVEGLTNYAKKFLKEAYGLELNIPIVINARMTSTLGFYKYESKESRKGLQIDIAKRVIEYGHDEVVINTLKHECIHYALHMLGKPFNDEDYVFEKELTKHDAGRYLEKTHVGVQYNHVCTKCGAGSLHNAKDLKKYVTPCCDAEYKLVLEIIADGLEVVKTIKY